VKGVYHINAVDCVTQWEIVATCERLFEAYLRPGDQPVLEGFPFTISGFYADNGSEYINQQVAGLRSPSLARAIRTTTAWRRPRTAPRCVSARPVEGDATHLEDRQKRTRNATIAGTQRVTRRACGGGVADHLWCGDAESAGPRVSTGGSMSTGSGAGSRAGFCRPPAPAQSRGGALVRHLSGLSTRDLHPASRRCSGRTGFGDEHRAAGGGMLA
jgi:hypothetical protein